jgi:PIN domain nuclease of toxin-antitoxin system
MEWRKRTVIYLDTHVIIWLYQKNIELFSKRAVEQIESNDIAVSPIVILELEYLFEIEKITEHANIIIDYLIKKTGLKVCEHSFVEVISKALDLKWTRDPFDRIITAHAQINDSPLLTKNNNILKHYQKALW